MVSCLLYGIVSLSDRTLLRLVTVCNLSLHQRTLNGNLLHIKLNSTFYNCTVVLKIKFRFLKTVCDSLNLNFTGERKNMGKDRFHGNDPYC